MKREFIDNDTNQYLSLKQNLLNEQSQLLDQYQDDSISLNQEIIDSEKNDLSLESHRVPKLTKSKRDAFHYKRRRKYKNKLQNVNEVFNFEEDKKLLQLIQLHGTRFKILKQFFNGRSITTLKNRYYKFLRYNWDTVLGSDYQHLNQRKTQDCNDYKNLKNQLENVHFFPEITTIMENFIDKMSEFLTQAIDL